MGDKPNAAVDLVMAGWLLAVPGIFLLLRPPRRALVVAFIAAWLVLPIASYPLPGLPDYDKVSATCLGTLLGALLFDFPRFRRLRLEAIDAAMIAWCVCPLLSSLTNGLGAYDGLSAVVAQTIHWGIPYLLGRAFLGDEDGLGELAVGVFVGGLAYALPCLYEVRLSPQLHNDLYGYHPHSFAQTLRFGGFRPTVFMHHGLMVALWMAAASLIGAWLWLTGALKRLRGVPLVFLIPPLVVAMVLCKSTGALILLLAGAAVLLVAWRLCSPVPVLCLIAIVPAYVGARTVLGLEGSVLVSAASDLVGEERAASLEVRLSNEDLLAAKALERPVFGWGAWGRARVYDQRGRDVSVTDGLWIIALGNHGVIGLSALMAAMLLPAAGAVRRSGRDIRDPDTAAATGLAVLVALYMIDCLFNAMGNPVFALAAGGLAGFATRGAGAAPVDAYPAGHPRPLPPPGDA